MDIVLTRLTSWSEHVSWSLYSMTTPPLSGAWYSKNPEFPKIGQSREMCRPECSENRFHKFPLSHICFVPEISNVSCLMVRNSEVQQFSNFTEAFPDNARSMCPSDILWWFTCCHNLEGQFMISYMTLKPRDGICNRLFWFFVFLNCYTFLH